MAPCNCLDVGGPLFPIAGVGVPVHDPGQDDVAQLGGSSDDERQCALDGGIIERIVGGIVIVAVAADAGIAWIFRLVLVVSQGQLVDLGFKAVIVSTDGVDDLPDGLVRAVAYGFLGRSLGGLGDGQDDVAELLALGRRITLPTACTTSMSDLRGCRNRMASRAGTSMPSVRQRALDRILQTPSAGSWRNQSSRSERLRAF